MEDPVDTFRAEARDLLEALERDLLDLDSSPNQPGLVDAAFRALHTLKGSGAMFGFDTVAAFVHEFETAFDSVRKGKFAVTSALVGLALEAKDHIERLIADPTHQGGDAVLEKLHRLLGAGTPSVAAIAADPDVPAWNVSFTLPADALSNGTDPRLLLEEIRAIGPSTVTVSCDAVPGLEDFEPERLYVSWDVRLEAQNPRAALDDVFMFLLDDMTLDVEPAGDAVAPHAMPESLSNRSLVTPVAEPERQVSNAVRVDAGRLDELMDRVGELVIAQARLSQLATSHQDPFLKLMAEDLERLTAGLRDTTMSIRMVPVGSLFARFRRLVRDLAEDLGKRIDFVTIGEDTELDKTVIDRLADPLVHLIRNSVDHGLELPSVRRLAGKSEVGTIRLEAAHTGAAVVITITDDGKGLDAERIRAKAVENGLIGSDAHPTEAELFQFVFAAGFSTAREVTTLSGRGVGMDVVKRTIEGLRGKIELASNAGKGTVATLRLPLTLAIVDGMLVRVGGERYVIPLSAVEECVELPATATQPGRPEFLEIRGRLIPFLSLRAALSVTQPAEDFPKAVIVSSGEGRVGLIVDQILGNHQTVIKQMSPLHADIQAFSGVTILGDGTVALILDTAHLVSSAGSLIRSASVGRAA